ncbi:DUF805 domain-containing protein, partial [Escherichia coli]|uniref:DUF805 domain-containing protein n=1 Tax=Escherichia coli TaxID=562 RepID=UPI001FCE8F4D
MQWYLSVLKNYVGFSGRARRKEYWMFTLINAIVGAIMEGANKQVISSQADSLIKISRIWADF